MKISDKRKEYFEVDVTMNEAEIQAIVGAIEQVQYYRNQPFENIGGIRQRIYEQFKQLIKD